MIHEVTTSYTKTNDLGLNFVNYKNGISSVCEKYGVPIADVSAVMSTRNTAICKKYTSTRLGVYPNGDGVHPNELGYETYYMPVIEAVLFPAAQPTEEPTSGQTRLLGDADGDGNISIVDATMIQRRLASYTVPDPEIVDQNGDIDADGLSITDATYIQRYLAQYTVPYGIGQPIV